VRATFISNVSIPRIGISQIFNFSQLAAAAAAPLCAAALKIQTQSSSNCNSSRFDIGAGKRTQNDYHCYII
jgi:hypothetical protein